MAYNPDAGMWLILSLKWSSGNDHLIWYRPGAHGYTSDINEAGRFTLEQARGYYLLGVTLPVPANEAVAYGEVRIVIPAGPLARERCEEWLNGWAKNGK